MKSTLPWILLIIAGFFEIFWAIGLKYTEGFTRLFPSVFTLITLAVSMYLLAKASQTIPIGTAYTVWVGIGAVGATVLGIFLLNEPANLPRLGFLFLLILSIVGLKLTA